MCWSSTKLGYQSCAPDAANVLYRVVNDRYLRRRPMLFTPIKPLAALGQMLHDGDLAAAILDRVINHGTHFIPRGRSCRIRNEKRAQVTDMESPAA